MIALRPLAAALTLLAMLGMPIATADAADLPSGYTCSDLRSKVAEFGRTLILAAARSQNCPSVTITPLSRCSARPLSATFGVFMSKTMDLRIMSAEAADAMRMKTLTDRETFIFDFCGWKIL